MFEISGLRWGRFEHRGGAMAKKTPGRNDPCPCGSGKKFKKCCLEKFQKKQRGKSSLNQSIKYGF